MRRRASWRKLARAARVARRRFLGRHDRWMWEGKYVTDSRTIAAFSGAWSACWADRHERTLTDVFLLAGELL